MAMNSIIPRIHYLYKIWKKIKIYFLYLIQKVYATCTLGLSSIQKYIVAICLIGYGVPSDTTNEYTRAAKKYSHGEYEAVCEGYSWILWKSIFMTSHARRFGKTNVNQQRKKLAMYVWLNRVHALPMKKLCSRIKWTIFREKMTTCQLFWKQ